MAKDVTVIVACHNFDLFLVEALSSILKQTVKPNKIIIVDDASTDQTEKISKSYLAQHPKIISYIKNNKNYGTQYSYNKALSSVKTEYYCILDADDCYMPTFIEKTKKILNTSHEFVLVYSDFELFGPRAESVFYEIDSKKYIGENGEFIIQFPEFNYSLLKKRNYIHNASLIRTESAKKIGGYKKHKTYELDHYFFLRLLSDSVKAYHFSESLLKYRQYSISQTSASYYIKLNYKNNLLNEKSNKELLKEYILLEKKILYLQKNLNKITTAKFYKLWQGFCNLRKKILQ